MPHKNLSNIFSYAFKAFEPVITVSNDGTVFQIIYLFYKYIEESSFIFTDQVLQILVYTSEVILMLLKFRFFFNENILSETPAN